MSGVEVTDENAAEIAASLIGRTITAFNRDPDQRSEWPQGENDLTITLDDGSVLEVSGWGFDSCGLSATYSAPALPAQ